MRNRRFEWFFKAKRGAHLDPLLWLSFGPIRDCNERSYITTARLLEDRVCDFFGESWAAFSLI
jgi:hypothetical protein